MLDLAREHHRDPADPRGLSRDRPRLSGRPDQHRRIFARRRRRPVRRPRHRRLRAEGQITGPIGLTGLIMFLYGIGILYGRQFFEGMTGAAGRKYNLLALVAVVAGLVVALGLGQAFGIKIGHTLGIFAGSMTSTATLQAALDVMKNSEPSIGYSIAYPFGVIGPILCIYFMTRQVKPKFPPKAQRFHMGEITLGDNYAGRTLERSQPRICRLACR